MKAADVKQGDRVELDRGVVAEVITVKAAGAEVASLIVRVPGIAASNKRVFPEDVVRVLKAGAVQ